MTEDERRTIERQLCAERERAELAEYHAHEAERECQQLRRLLSRYHTSLAEQFNDPAQG